MTAGLSLPVEHPAEDLPLRLAERPGRLPLNPEHPGQLKQGHERYTWLNGQVGTRHMTRVFNVSHHKCGTNSVHRALEILGFRSYHWENPFELMQRHLDGTIEEEPLFQPDNTAFNDLPITLMYRELYRIFPEDKFIFVRRDRESWVESLRQHLLRFWPVPLSVHTLVYGYPLKASNFDAEVCLRVYDRLCGDILEFFNGKPNFLLIEFKDLSWRPLCLFLDRPEPDQPFPWQNKTIRQPRNAFRRGTE